MTVVEEVSYFLTATMPEPSRELGLPPQPAEHASGAAGTGGIAIAVDLDQLQRRAATRVGQEIRAGYPHPAGIQVLPDPILAIDFGTSSSAVAVTDIDKVVRCVPAPQGQALMPSTVTFAENLDYRVGGAPGSADPDQLTPGCSGTRSAISAPIASSTLTGRT